MLCFRRGRLWTCPYLVESHCLLLCFVFELYGAFVAEGRVPADGIIKAIDISGDGIFGLVWQLVRQISSDLIVLNTVSTMALMLLYRSSGFRE